MLPLIRIRKARHQWLSTFSKDIIARTPTQSKITLCLFSNFLQTHKPRYDLFQKSNDQFQHKCYVYASRNFSSPVIPLMRIRQARHKWLSTFCMDIIARSPKQSKSCSKCANPQNLRHEFYDLICIVNELTQLQHI